MQGFPGSSEPPNLAQLQSTMQTLEIACSSFQMDINHAASDPTILSFSQSPQPYQACKFILENSQVENARFQAAVAFKDAAIREWGFLTSDEKITLISFCLSHVMDQANYPEGYIQLKVSSVAAQLLKRGWLEFTDTEKEAFFYRVNQAISGNHGVHMQFAGIKILESLVSEFSPSTSSAMGLPMEFHEQCRKSLELEYLKIFYCSAQEAALRVTNQIIESQNAIPEVKVCIAVLQFMLQILRWDFRAGTNNRSTFSAGIREGSDSSKRSDCNLIQPGHDWREVLVTTGHTSWILSLYSALRRKFSYGDYWMNCPIAISARELIVQFCSLTGTIFPSDNLQLHEHYLRQLLSEIIEWMDPPDVVSEAIENGKNESEMFDGCRALLSIATVTSPSVFHQLLIPTRHFGALTFLSTLTCEVIKALMNNNNAEETWSWEARDILLDAWVALLTPVEENGENSLLPPEGRGGAASLFILIVESELKAAAALAFNDDVDYDYHRASVTAMDERLSSYALIGRAAIDVTIPLLIELFSMRFERLHQGRAIADPTETLEEIYSLLLVTGHVLADEGEGETPLVPNVMKTHFSDTMEAEEHPVIVLCSSIIRFAEQCLDPNTRASVFSPRLMEVIIWFLARWSCTYLMSPEENIDMSTRNVLVSYFGKHHQGRPVLEIVVRISLTALVSYPGKTDLQALTCHQLLHSLVRQKHVCASLVTLDSWHELANVFSNEKNLFLLKTIHQRSLAQTFVRSASGMRNFESSNQYVRDVVANMATYLVEMSSMNDFENIAQQPDIIYSVSCSLERLRGAASASEPCLQKAIYDLGFSVLNPVLVLLVVYKHEPAVVYLLLKFVVDWVDGQINYLEAQETAVVVQFCMSLLQLYSSHNIGKILLSHSSNLLGEANTDKYTDLCALLQLLSNLCSKDLVDLSSDSAENQGTNISQVVYFGLHIITPLLSLELLKYPKLCHDYFSLLSHLLEVYPETVAQLNTEAFSHVLETIDFGLFYQDEDIVHMCLRALRTIASYHYVETSAGRIGLRSHAAVIKDPSGSSQEGLLSRFLRSLLRLLFLEEYCIDLVGSAADALLPLILCEQDMYKKVGYELIERINPTFRSRLDNALQLLTSANHLSSTLDRRNYQIFRKNLSNFLIDVRGFVCKR